VTFSLLAALPRSRLAQLRRIARRYTRHGSQMRRTRMSPQRRGAYGDECSAVRVCPSIPASILADVPVTPHPIMPFTPGPGSWPAVATHTLSSSDLVSARPLSCYKSTRPSPDPQQSHSLQFVQMLQPGQDNLFGRLLNLARQKHLIQYGINLVEIKHQVQLAHVPEELIQNLDKKVDSL
jgi:hypothetical protein